MAIAREIANARPRWSPNPRATNSECGGERWPSDEVDRGRRRVVPEDTRGLDAIYLVLTCARPSWRRIASDVSNVAVARSFKAPHGAAVIPRKISVTR